MKYSKKGFIDFNTFKAIIICSILAFSISFGLYKFEEGRINIGKDRLIMSFETYKFMSEVDIKIKEYYE